MHAIKASEERIWEAGFRFGCPKIEVAVPVGMAQWHLLSKEIQDRVVKAARGAAFTAVREAVAGVMTEKTPQ